jgi:hypothetical protein
VPTAENPEKKARRFRLAPPCGAVLHAVLHTAYLLWQAKQVALPLLPLL